MIEVLRKLKIPTLTVVVAGLSYYLAPPSIYKSVAQIALSEEDKMSIASKIAGNAIKRAPSGPEVTFGEVWKGHRCVLVFFRRFG